jgi:hypothetical protein
MPYKTTFHGHEVICDTVQELAALLDTNATSSGRRRNHPEKRTPRNAKGWAKATADKPRQALEALAASHPESISDEEIKDKLNLESNRKIAGIMGSLAKSAKKSGLTFESLVVKEATRNGNGERHYRYGIGPTAIAEIKQGLGMKE